MTSRSSSINQVFRCRSVSAATAPARENDDDVGDADDNDRDADTVVTLSINHDDDESRNRDNAATTNTITPPECNNEGKDSGVSIGNGRPSSSSLRSIPVVSSLTIEPPDDDGSSRSSSSSSKSRTSNSSTRSTSNKQSSGSRSNRDSGSRSARRSNSNTQGSGAASSSTRESPPAPSVTEPPLYNNNNSTNSTTDGRFYDYDFNRSIAAFVKRGSPNVSFRKRLGVSFADNRGTDSLQQSLVRDGGGGGGGGATFVSNVTSDEMRSRGTSSSVSSIDYPHRPNTTLFREQRLPAWQNALSPTTTIMIYLFLGVAFLAVGTLMVVESETLPSIKQRYDNQQNCPVKNRYTSLGYACAPIRLSLDVRKTLKGPVFMYYEIEGFYQNDYWWATSKNVNQLTRHHNTDSYSVCTPFKHPGEYISLGNESEIGTVYYDDKTTASLPNATYWPCGIVAWSMFNDTFVLFKGESEDAVDKAVQNKSENKGLTLVCDGGAFDKNGNPLDPTRPQNCRKKRIAWDSDPGVRFTPAIQSPKFLTHEGWSGACELSRWTSSPYNAYACNGWYVGEAGHQIPSPEDEDLMVWTRISPHYKFRKLYRVIEQDLEPGTYMMEIFQRYDLSSFGGKKWFVLEPSSSMPRNFTLGVVYLVVGALLFILGITFLTIFKKDVKIEGSE